MTNMSDAPYNKMVFLDKDKWIANIHLDMYQYVQGTIKRWICDRYFMHYYAEYYINHDDLEKCRSYLRWSGKGFHHHVLNPIANVALEIFRYEHPDARQAEFPFGNEREFFADIYIDTDFLDKIDECFWYLCKKTYHFIKDEICQTPCVVVNMGKAFMSHILDNYDVPSGEQIDITNAMNFAYKAAGELQRQHPEIKWWFWYDG